MNISTLLTQTEPFSIEWNGETVTFQAYKNALTPQLSQQWVDAARKPLGLAYFAASVVESWDVDMNGEPFPPTPDNFAIIPTKFIEKMLDMVAESWTGDSGEVNASDNGSEATAK